MNILLAYVILNNRYSIQTKYPKFYSDIEGKVAEYCAYTNGCRECNLYQDIDCLRFTSHNLNCYRGFLVKLYFPET